MAIFTPDHFGEVGSAEKTWVILAPYLWLPAIKGNVTARGMTQPVDVSLSDVFGMIDDVRGAVQLHVEAGKGQWGFILDGQILSIAPSERTPAGGQVDVEFGVTIIEFLGARRLLEVPLGSSF